MGKLKVTGFKMSTLVFLLPHMSSLIICRDIYDNNSPTCLDAERKNKKNYKWRRPSNESVDISVDIKLPPKGYWTVPKSSPTHLDEVSALRAHQTKKKSKNKNKIKYLNNFILVCKLTGGG